MSVLDKIAEIQRLLVEAYDDYFARSDGYCKSSEGAIELNWGTYWDLKDGKTEPVAIGVYSYCLGPSRMHYFKTLDEALATVTEWRDEQLAKAYDEHGERTD